MNEIYDDYTIISNVGQGTYGHVYKAIESGTGRIVAIKQISKTPTNQHHMTIDDLPEISSLQTVESPNIIALLNVIQKPKSNYIYLIFDYYPYDLKQILKTDRSLDIYQIKSFAAQMVNGLAATHKENIIHCDIKPANIFIDNTSHVYIGDFGLSCHIDPNQNTPLNKQIATLWYRSPELLLGSNEYSYEIDIWSLGCVFYEMITGKTLFTSVSQTEKAQFTKIMEICGPIPDGTLQAWSKLGNFSSFIQSNINAKIIQNSENVSLAAYLDLKVPETDDMKTEIRQELAWAKDLICRMLRYDPNERITAAEILSHPFITQNQIELQNLPQLNLPESKLIYGNEENISPPILKIPTPRILPTSIL